MTNTYSKLRSLESLLRGSFPNYNIKGQLHGNDHCSVSVDGEQLSNYFSLSDPDLGRKVERAVRERFPQVGAKRAMATEKDKITLTLEPCHQCGGYCAGTAKEAEITRSSLILNIRSVAASGTPNSEIGNIVAVSNRVPKENMSSSLVKSEWTYTLTNGRREKITVTLKDALAYRPTSEDIRRALRATVIPSAERVSEEVANRLSVPRVDLDGGNDDFTLTVYNPDGTSVKERFVGAFDFKPATPTATEAAPKALLPGPMASVPPPGHVNRDAAMAAVKALNDAFRLDPEAVFFMLYSNRVPCSQRLTAHSTVQLGVETATGRAIPTLGPLGFLNGALEAATGYRIAICVDEATEEFKGFQIYGDGVGISGDRTV